MAAKKDLTGMKFGRLTVVEAAGRDKNRATKWLCRCECGNTTISPRSSLLRGHCKSCGCFQKERARDLVIQRNSGKPGPRRIGAKVAEQRRFLRYLKSGARHRGYPVLLSDSALISIAELPCAYCGSPPKRTTCRDEDGALTTRKAAISADLSYYDNDPWFANGVDRIDSSRGYVEGNCAPCCTRCNWLKSNRELSELMAQIKRIYEHLNLGETVKEKV